MEITYVGCSLITIMTSSMYYLTKLPHMDNTPQIAYLIPLNTKLLPLLKIFLHPTPSNLPRRSRPIRGAPESGSRSRRRDKIKKREEKWHREEKEGRPKERGEVEKRKSNTAQSQLISRSIFILHSSANTLSRKERSSKYYLTAFTGHR